MPDATLATLYLIFRKCWDVRIVQHKEEPGTGFRFSIQFMPKDFGPGTVPMVWGDDLDELIHKVWKEVNK